MLIVSHGWDYISGSLGGSFRSIVTIREFNGRNGRPDHIVRTLTRSLMRLRNCSEKPRRPRLCNCAIIAIRACTSTRPVLHFHSKNLSASRESSSLLSADARRDTRVLLFARVTFTRPTDGFIRCLQDYGNADLRTSLTINRDHGPDCRSLDPRFQWKRWVTFNKSACDYNRRSLAAFGTRAMKRADATIYRRFPQTATQWLKQKTKVGVMIVRKNKMWELRYQRIILGLPL